MKNIFLGLKFSFSYFSILPINFRKEDDLSKKSIIKAMLFFFPFVGFILGVLTILSSDIFNSLGYLGYLMSAILYMGLYGFLHTEAILDVVDALYAKHSGKDAYKIIKEPTVGAMGILWGVSFVILKLAFIVSVLDTNLFYEFILIVIFSRLSLLININLFTAHSGSSFINSMKESLSKRFISVIFILYFVLGFIFVSFNIFLIVLSVVGSSIIISNYLKNKLGFLNGDVLGSSLEVSELIGMIVILVLMGSS